MSNDTENYRDPKGLDPMKDVMPFELLEAAFSLWANKQNVYYWGRCPKPKRPVGKVRYEVARQVSTFAIPLVGLGLAWTQYGMQGLLIGAPVAWALGWALDYKLQRDIAKKRRSDNNVDRGRYNAVKWLSEQMGRTPESITYPLIEKMAADYIRVMAERKLAEEEAAKRRAEYIRSYVQKRRSYKSRSGYAEAATQGAGVAAAVVANEAIADDEPSYEVPSFEEPDTSFETMSTPSFNPANGLPMLDNTMIDVMGNTYGTDFN